MLNDMINSIEVYDKETHNVLKLYNLCVDNSGRIVGIVYDADLAAKQNGYGWKKIKPGRLIPLEYANGKTGFQSKTHRNKIKHMLKMDKTTWVCTDGTEFFSTSEDGHAGLQKAIEHQESLMDNRVS